MKKFNDHQLNAQEKNCTLITTELDFNLYTRAVYKCKYHGEFQAQPYSFFNSKYGCEKCSYEARAKNYANNDNNKKYTAETLLNAFSKLEYMVNEYKVDHDVIKDGKRDRKIKLICSKHGESIRFTHQAADTGCLQCRKDFKENKKEIDRAKKRAENNRVKSNKSRTTPVDEVLKILTEKYGDKFSYDLTGYENLQSVMTVTCKKHGSFNIIIKSYMQTSYGCRSCANAGTSKAEYDWLASKNIDNMLYQHKIEYMPNKFLFTDGYDPTTNTIYEYLGDYWHGNIGKYKKDFFNKKSKKTMIELFDITQDRFKMLSDMGYNIIYRWDSSDDFIYDNKLEY